MHEECKDCSAQQEDAEVFSMNDRSTVDLHMHTICSVDGDFTPQALMERCAQKGMKVVAVADHNSVKAVGPAREAAKKLGIGFVSGVEIDCTFDGIDLHLLGYGIDETAPCFIAHQEKVFEEMRQKGYRMLDKARGLGLTIEKDVCEKLCLHGVYTAEVILEAAMMNPKNDEHPVIAPYLPGGARCVNPLVNFYWDYYAQGMPCHVPQEWITFEDACRMIRSHGGVTVLAHPGAMIRGRDDVLERIIATGLLDGIEVYSSYHNAEDAAHYKEAVIKHGLLATAGSDFHGRIKPAIEMGTAMTEKEQEELLLALAKKGFDVAGGYRA